MTVGRPLGRRGSPLLLPPLALGAWLLLLAGCGSLLGIGGSEPADLYNLLPERNFSSEVPTVSWQLVVEEPLASGGFDSNRIAVRPSPTQLQYLAGARWTDRVPRMVQNLIVQSFEDSGRIVAVGRHTVGLRSDYNLKLEIREFQAEYFRRGQPPTVRVRINAKLVRQPRQEIIASRNFERVVEAEAREAKAVVDAFDLALGRVIRELVEWTLLAPAGSPSD